MDPKILITKEGYLANKYSCQRLSYIRWECIDITQSLGRAAMLTQIIYWHEPNSKNQPRLRIKYENKLWLVKRLDQWWDECRITERMAKRYLKELVDSNLITVKRRYFQDLPAHFISLNWDVYIAKLNEHYASISTNFSSNVEAKIKGTPGVESHGADMPMFDPDGVEDGVDSGSILGPDGEEISPPYTRAEDEQTRQFVAPNDQNGRLVRVANDQNGRLVLKANDQNGRLVGVPNDQNGRLVGDQTTKMVDWSLYTYITKTNTTETYKKPPYPLAGDCAVEDGSVVEDQNQHSEETQPRVQSAETQDQVTPDKKETWVVNRYNEIATKLGYPTIAKYTPKRSTKVRSRLKDFPDKKVWTEMFNRLEKSDYFTGQDNSWFGFDYIMRSSETFEKIRTGAFDFKRGKSPVNHLSQTAPNGQLPPHLQNTGFILENGVLTRQTQTA